MYPNDPFLVREMAHERERRVRDDFRNAKDAKAARRARRRAR